MWQKSFYVYILTNKSYNFYVGVTSNLSKRLWQHKENFYPNSFTGRYNIHKLIYFEVYDFPLDAIGREKQIKKYSRKKKIELIRSMNPNYRDLGRDWGS